MIIDGDCFAALAMIRLCRNEIPPTLVVSILRLLTEPDARLEREALYRHYALEKAHFPGGLSSGLTAADSQPFLIKLSFVFN